MERALAKSRHRQEAPKPARRRIRLMIVDDSMIARAVLSRMVESDGSFEIAAVAGTAEDAIDALQAVNVDTILLDLEMPGAGGLKLIPAILKAADGARVMIVSSFADEGAEQTVAALALGAADAMPKPGTGRFNGRFAEVLVAKLKAIGFVDDQPPLLDRPGSLYDRECCLLARLDVLLYLTDRLASALAPDGWLMLGAGETVIGQTDRFGADVEARGLYRRTDGDAVVEKRACADRRAAAKA